MTHDEILDNLSEDAYRTATFGYQADGGYSELYRDESGNRWVVSNGNENSIAPFVWTIEQINCNIRLKH